MLTIDLFEEHEGPPEPTLIDALRDFLPIAVKHLKIKELPKIKLLGDVETDHMPSFGKFSNDDRTVHLGIKNRHPNDILRTLAHELTHYAQGEHGKLDADSWHTGSPVEDQANAEAGVIMREFNKQFPQYMALKPIVFEEWSKKYKKSINCNNPKGFSQKAHCAGRKKNTNEAEEGCPPATQDIALNLKNRQKAIDEYHYGPLNPNLPNDEYWQELADKWNTRDIDSVKQNRCGNCGAFDVSKDMQACIAKGIGSEPGSSAMDAVDAGQLGYCKFLKFKCASKRTCDAWIEGGPITEGQHCDAKNAVPELKAALTKRKTELKNASAKTAYDKIDKIMTRIAQTYNISGQKLHDLWTERYGEIPDTWVLGESKETRQALSDQHFEFPQQGQYGYRTGYQGRGVLELADGRTGKIINLGEFGDFDDEYKPNQKWLRIVFTNPNMDDNAWNELEDMLWSDDQVAENFADGKGPGKPGDSQRHGIPKGATMAELEKAAKASGRKGQLARWQINMRRGKKK